MKMLAYSLLILTLTVLRDGQSKTIKESYSCRNSVTNEVCVGHQLDCEQGKEIYVLNGQYMYSKTETNCSNLPNGKCMMDNRSNCSRDYSESVMDDVLLKCNGLRSCRPPTPRGVSGLYCVKWNQFRYSRKKSFPTFYRLYTLSYLSYTCISAPKILKIDENIGRTKTANSSHVVVMGDIKPNTTCSLRVDHSVDFVFIQSNKENSNLQYYSRGLRPLHRYVVRRFQRYFKLSFRGPLTDLKINLITIGRPSRELDVTTHCWTETVTTTSRSPYPEPGPNPNPEPAPNPEPNPYKKTTTSSSTTTPITTTTNGRSDRWEDIEDSDGETLEKLFNTTSQPVNQPVIKEWKLVLAVSLFAFVGFFITLSLVLIAIKRKALARAKVRQQAMRNGIGNPVFSGEPFVSFSRHPPPGYFDNLDVNRAGEMVNGYGSPPPSYSKATGVRPGNGHTDVNYASGGPTYSYATSDPPNYSNATSISDPPTYSNATSISGPPTYSNATSTSDPPTYSNATSMSDPPVYSNATVISDPPTYSNAAGSGPVASSVVSDISDPPGYSRENGVSFINVSSRK